MENEEWGKQVAQQIVEMRKVLISMDVPEGTANQIIVNFSKMTFDIRTLEAEFELSVKLGKMQSC